MAKYILLLSCLSLFACDEESENTAVAPSSSSAAPLATGALTINGTLVNAAEDDNQSVTAGQNVKIVRNDGFVVASTTSDDNGQYQFDIAEGGLVLDTSFALTSGTTETATTAATSDDFAYSLVSEIPDDGRGKALGIRQKIELTEDIFQENSSSLELGDTNLKEVTAIIGKVSFEDTGLNADGTDVFIPGQSYFLRTGDTGAFGLLFVPSGKYFIRIEKAPYRKDIEVEVLPGKTLDLSMVTVKKNERNPLPLAEVLIGSWNATCYYTDNPSGINPENPTTGTITITSLEDISVTGKSCFMRTEPPATRPFGKLIMQGDGGIVALHEDGGGKDYYFHQVTDYGNNRVVISADPTSFSSPRVIEVLVRK